MPDRETLFLLLELRDGSKLFHKTRGRELFGCNKSHAVWNARFAGNEAFQTVDPFGYRYGVLLRRKHRLHSVLFKMRHGYEPILIDHIDGDVTNNSIDNLRPGDTYTNARNMGLSKRNKSGVRGVHRTRSGRWISQIRFGGVTVHLGSFETLEEAKSVRNAQEAKYGYMPQRKRKNVCQ